MYIVDLRSSSLPLDRRTHYLILPSLPVYVLSMRHSLQNSAGAVLGVVAQGAGEKGTPTCTECPPSPLSLPLLSIPGSVFYPSKEETTAVDLEV